MKYTYAASALKDTAADILITFTASIDKVTGKLLKDIDRAVDGGLAAMVASGEFTGQCGEIASLVAPKGFKSRRLLLVGLGDENDINAESFRKATGHVSRHAAVKNARGAAFHFGSFDVAAYFQATVEGYLLGSYQYLDYKTGDAAKEKSKLAAIKFVAGKSDDVSGLKTAITTGQAMAEGQLLCRALAHTPSRDLTPRVYAKKAQQLARKHGLKCQVLDEKAIEREKMGAFLSVAQGSVEPPRFIILHHNGGRAGQKPVVLVGKGITFDSGGISLKPALNMHEMKQDMAGSAAVLAIMITAARLRLPLNVVALIPTCENMPSGNATRPGDVVTSRKGLTIEVINTDAEGRLILADALDYANKFKPQAVIDMATLTGATLYILGHAGAPILGNNEALLARLDEAAWETGERVWELPIWDDHRAQMKSGIADLVNSGGRPAGTIAAAAFLENFIGDWPWAHIDIASVDLEAKGTAYTPSGATGFGVRLVVEMLAGWKKL
ncbi:MAG: leucyl aminopeptidase [candidate division Zixibacteria bacterium]|nr:leucyl aminopeptidase [candidate division Zixibacteria bacterium]